MKLEDAYSLEEKLWPTYSILKSRDITLPTKVRLVKAMVFPVVMYGCESWTIKKPQCWFFWNMVLEKTLESLLDCKEIKPVHPKGNQSWILIGRTDVEAETPEYFGHLMWRSDSLEKTLMLGKTEGRRRRGWQRLRWLDGITDSMDMSLSSRSCWWTEKTGMLQSMGSQRVVPDWATELNWPIKARVSGCFASPLSSQNLEKYSEHRRLSLNV